MSLIFTQALIITYIYFLTIVCTLKNENKIALLFCQGFSCQKKQQQQKFLREIFILSFRNTMYTYYIYIYIYIYNIYIRRSVRLFKFIFDLS